MPKRMIDGEKLWGSDKLREVQPESFRAEYANLIPLALSNGSFECQPEKVWAKIYAYNRPSIIAETVKEILDEFERVKLLFRWKVDGKDWGYWTGIEKEGLLPSDGHKNRYKKGENPPEIELNSFLNKHIEQHPDQLRSASGCYPAGFGLGLDLVSSCSSREDEVSFKQNLSDKFLETFGQRIYDNDASWDDLMSLFRLHGAWSVLQAFDQWATNLDGEKPNYPASAFAKYATPILFAGAELVKANKPLIRELAYLSDNRVTFNDKQATRISQLLGEYTEDEIKSALREYLDGLDEYHLRFAAKDFSEKADQLIYTQRKRKETMDKALAVIAQVENTPVVIPEEEPEPFEL